MATKLMQIQAGQKAIFTAESGRKIEVVVQSIDDKRAGLATATVAQVADTSKVKTLFVSQLTALTGERLATAEDIAEQAKYAALNRHIASTVRYECLECGAKHSKSVCPECGSQDRIENTEVR